MGHRRFSEPAAHQECSADVLSVPVGPPRTGRLPSSDRRTARL